MSGPSNQLLAPASPRGLTPLLQAQRGCWPATSIADSLSCEIWERIFSRGSFGPQQLVQWYDLHPARTQNDHPYCLAAASNRLMYQFAPESEIDASPPIFLLGAFKARVGALEPYFRAAVNPSWWTEGSVDEWLFLWGDRRNDLLSFDAIMASIIACQQLIQEIEGGGKDPEQRILQTGLTGMFSEFYWLDDIDDRTIARAMLRARVGPCFFSDRLLHDSAFGVRIFVEAASVSVHPYLVAQDPFDCLDHNLLGSPSFYRQVAPYALDSFDRFYPGVRFDRDSNELYQRMLHDKRVVIEHLAHGGAWLGKRTEHFEDDAEVMNAGGFFSGYLFSFASERLRGDEQFVRQFHDKPCRPFKVVLKSDDDFQGSGFDCNCLAFLCGDLPENRDLVRHLYESHAVNPAGISKVLLRDRDFLLSLQKKIPMALISDICAEDFDVVLRHWSAADGAHRLPKTILQSRPCVLALLKRNPAALEELGGFAGFDDKEMVLTAVSHQFGLLARYTLRCTGAFEDEDFLEQAFRLAGSVEEGAIKVDDPCIARLISDFGPGGTAFLRCGIRTGYITLAKAGATAQDSLEVVLTAVLKDKESLHHASARLQHDKELRQLAGWPTM